MPRQTYMNQNWEQISIKCPNCLSENVELEEYNDIDNIGTYYCLDCETLFEYNEND